MLNYKHIKPEKFAEMLEHGYDEGNWQEDFNHENGCYQCLCLTCGNEFIGHKRRITCKVCAAPADKVED